MSSLYKRSILIFLGAVLARMVFHAITGFTSDDAFVTYRYAMNIAFAHGFVYNLNEPILGISTPLYAMLLSLFEVLRLPPPNASQFLSLIASGFTAVVVYRFAHSLRFTRVTFLPTLIYILWPRSIPSDSSGLELAFFSLLVTSAFYYQHKRKPFYSIALATLATLTRPEGLLLLVVLVGYNIVHERHRRSQLLAVPVLLLIPWLVFAAFYFGSVIPNSMRAVIATSDGFGTSLFFSRLVEILQLTNPVGWILILTLLAGYRWLHTKQNTGNLELIWLAASIVIYSAAPVTQTLLYIAPIYPVYLLLSAASIPSLFDTVHPSLDTMQKTTAIGAIVLTLLLIGGCFYQIREFGAKQDRLNRVNRAVGDYLYRTADRDTDWAAIEDVGYIGYFSDLKILDRSGRLSPQALPYIRSGDNLALIRDYQPRWVGLKAGSKISGFTFDGSFLEKYALEKTFVFDEKPEYYLYVRRDD